MIALKKSNGRINIPLAFNLYPSLRDTGKKIINFI